MVLRVSSCLSAGLLSRPGAPCDKPCSIAILFLFIPRKKKGLHTAVLKGERGWSKLKVSLVRKPRDSTRNCNPRRSIQDGTDLFEQLEVWSFFCFSRLM